MKTNNTHTPSYLFILWLLLLLPSVSKGTTYDTINDNNWFVKYSWTSGNCDWTHNTKRPGGYMNDDHFANGQAVCSFSFIGTGIQIYGCTGSDLGNMEVTIDGSAIPGSPFNLNCKNGDNCYNPHQLLCKKTDLRSGMHTIMLRPVGNSKIDLDNFVVINPPQKSGLPHEIFTSVQPGNILITGFVGARIDTAVSSTKSILLDSILNHYENRKNWPDYVCEHWGKCFRTYVQTKLYRPSDEQFDKMANQMLSRLLATQTSDGYIGCYPLEFQAQKSNYDVWSRMHILTGLIAYYSMIKDSKSADAATVLDAIRKEADYTISQIGPGKINILNTSPDGGMAATTIAKPFLKLYDIIKLKNKIDAQKYYDFAVYIVNDCSNSTDTYYHHHLIDYALHDSDVININPKSYEMQASYEPYLDLYKETGDSSLFKAVENIWNNIDRNEVMLSCQVGELWHYGKFCQTERPQSTSEKVVPYHDTFAPFYEASFDGCGAEIWIKLSERLLELTGDAKYANRMETTMYNALFASMSPDGRKFGWINQSCGKRGNYDQLPKLQCCETAVPMAITHIPFWAVMNSNAGPVINLYCESSAKVFLESGNTVSIIQKTKYPFNNLVHFSITPQKSETFSVRFRIPEWSKATQIKINGTLWNSAIAPGTYAEIRRSWNKNDQVDITFDFTPHVIYPPTNSRFMVEKKYFAIQWGPIVLAADKRLNNSIDQVLNYNKSMGIDLVQKTSPDNNFNLVFDLFLLNGKERSKAITLCDLASAGNNTFDLITNFSDKLNAFLSTPAQYRVFLPY
jgi:uncharacterized protein